jgi:hypothetical protein
MNLPSDEARSAVAKVDVAARERSEEASTGT